MSGMPTDRQRRRRRLAGALVCGLLASFPAFAQQLEPRSYSPSPLNTNFVGISYVNSSGDVLFDPSVPIENVNADRQNNTRAGLTLAIPLPKGNSLKLAYARGATARVGGKFNTLSLGWQFFWFDRSKAPASQAH